MFKKFFIFFSILFFIFPSFTQIAKSFNTQEIVEIKKKILEIDSYVSKSRNKGFIQKKKNFKKQN